jgi:hypothetical protein
VSEAPNQKFPYTASEVGELKKQLEGNGVNRGVDLVGIDVPFLDLMVFLIKLSLAAIPAAFIVFIVYAITALVLAAVFGIYISSFWP